MNNTFDFKRFGQVLTKDWKQYFRNYGIALAVLVCLPVLLWVATLVLDVKIDADSRTPLLLCIVVGALVIAPSKVYGKANLSREGVSFAMMPATSLEKFFSMVLYCSIFTPIVCGLGCWGIDSLLTLMPFGGFDGFVTIFPPSISLSIKVRIIMLLFLLFVLTSSYFLYGNMIFKKGKAWKTFAWLLLIHFVLILMIQIPFINKPAVYFFFDLAGEDTVCYQRVINSLIFAMAILVDYLTYRRIKNQKY